MGQGVFRTTVLERPLSETEEEALTALETPSCWRFQSYGTSAKEKLLTGSGVTPKERSMLYYKLKGVGNLKSMPIGFLGLR